MSSSSSKKKGRPAFDGAAFDKDGNCVKHKSMQLAEQVKQDGRLLWKEIKMNCPKCAAEHHKSRRVTSLGGAGKIKRGRTVHGMSNPLRNSQKSGRHMDVEFDTPFDDKGRCHHHHNVQMASKKRSGGWKILVPACPKCIEAKYEEDEGSVNSRASSRASSRYSRGGKSNNGGGGASDYDDASVSSKSTKRSVTSRPTKPATSSGKFDKNGCCTKHPTVQVSKKKLLGGWKEFRTCPKCIDPHYDDMADNASVSSRTSRRSTTSFRSTGSARSRKSTKSVKSNGSRKGGRKTDRYGALPFDTEGYCHAHPSVRLAKKKALGGWKVLHDICPDCAHDASSNAGSTRSGRSRGSRKSSKSGTGRYYDDSGSDTSSYKSGKSSSSSRKKKIRVKDMRYSDENNKEGRYSGDVNEDHQPNGEGKMKYKDGSAFTGVWSEGSQVHGKTSKKKSSSKSKSSGSGDKKSSSSGGGGGSGGKKSSSDGEWARRDAILNDGSSNKKVRKMKWMDYYGDPGEYTGEINSSNMPNGKGSMKYDHGLIQDGLWAKGQFVEGSDLDGGADGGGASVAATDAITVKKSGRSKSGEGGGQVIVKKSSRSREGGGERSSRKPSSKGGSSSRRLEP